jgi:hypothetical protein
VRSLSPISLMDISAISYPDSYMPYWLIVISPYDAPSGSVICAM